MGMTRIKTPNHMVIKTLIPCQQPTLSKALTIRRRTTNGIIFLTYEVNSIRVQFQQPKAIVYAYTKIDNHYPVYGQ